MMWLDGYVKILLYKVAGFSVWKEIAVTVPDYFYCIYATRLSYLEYTLDFSFCLVSFFCKMTHNIDHR
jgi:hypothetical protein